MKKLFETDHPYYCEEINYYERNSNHEFQSWKDFLNEFENSDPDLNLVFRWDWHKQNLEEDENSRERINIFFMAQRKGKYYSCTVYISQEDESAIKEWFQIRWNKLKELWDPFN